GDIDQTTCQVTAVGGLERGIDHGLAGTAGRGKVLKRGQTLLVAGLDRQLDGLTGRIHGDTQHTDGRFNLADVTAGAGDDGNGHAAVFLGELLGQSSLDLLVDVHPVVNGQ